MFSRKKSKGREGKEDEFFSLLTDSDDAGGAIGGREAQNVTGYLEVRFFLPSMLDGDAAIYRLSSSSREASAHRCQLLNSVAQTVQLELALNAIPLDRRLGGPSKSIAATNLFPWFPPSSPLLCIYPSVPDIHD